VLLPHGIFCLKVHFAAPGAQQSVDSGRAIGHNWLQSQ